MIYPTSRLHDGLIVSLYGSQAIAKLGAPKPRECSVAEHPSQNLMQKTSAHFEQPMNLMQTKSLPTPSSQYE